MKALVEQMRSLGNIKMSRLLEAIEKVLNKCQQTGCSW